MDGRLEPRYGLAVVAAFLLVLTSCGGDGPSSAPSEMPSASPTPLVSPAPFGGKQGLVTYAEKGDVWLYDVETDRVARLTDDGEQVFDRGPVFLGGDEVLAITDADETSALRAIALADGTVRVIADEAGRILDVDVSPDGATIAYLVVEYSGDGVHRVMTVATTGGDPREILKIGRVIGRGANSEDEVSLAWSGGGDALLVTDTHVPRERSGEPTISVIDRNGRDIVPPWVGTHARWSPDGATVYYRGWWTTADRERRWRVYDVASQHAELIGARGGTNFMAVSPHGRRLAYDTSAIDFAPLGEEVAAIPVTYGYGLSSSYERVLAERAMAPVWISNDEMLVSDARAAREGENTLNSWVLLGTASRVAFDGTRTRVAMTSTLDADFLPVE